jgi:hypothetical protein
LDFYWAKALVVTNAYIVKLKSSADLAVRSLNAHDEFHKRAIASIDYTTRHEYADEALFLGLSLSLLDNNDLQSLRDMEDAEQVWPVYSVERLMVVAKPRTAPNNEPTSPRSKYSWLPISTMKHANISR